MGCGASLCTVGCNDKTFCNNKNCCAVAASESPRDESREGHGSVRHFECLRERRGTERNGLRSASAAVRWAKGHWALGASCAPPSGFCADGLKQRREGAERSV